MSKKKTEKSKISALKKLRNSLNFGVINELRQVTWPTRAEMFQMTMYVVVVVSVLSLITFGLDYLFLQLQEYIF